MAPTFPFTRLEPVEVFAVEDCVAQLTWRDLPSGEVAVVVDGTTQALGSSGRRGAADISGLRPATTHSIAVQVDGRTVAEFAVPTTESLGGPARTKIATISDLHLGETGFGLLKEMTEPDHRERDYPLRCAQAAVAEATAWGADLLVIKGDITDYGMPEHWELFDELLDTIRIPVVAIPGNHDTFAKPGSLDAHEQLRQRALCPTDVQTVDIPGIRVIAADTTTPGHSWGRIHHLENRLIEAVDTHGPALVFFHHHLEPHRTPRIWPIGTPRRQAAPLLARLLEANPDLVISSGHTHRNRARTHGSATITEVGATKDFPGVWAGYVVHDNGIRQVVRRVAEPSCIEWNDRTHAAVGGVWGRWSPGRMADRSFVRNWRRAAAPAAQPSEASSASV
ncbi:MAG: metallophosphoesterase [Acidimicrobiales bacterium]